MNFERLLRPMLGPLFRAPQVDMTPAGGSGPSRGDAGINRAKLRQALRDWAAARQAPLVISAPARAELIAGAEPTAAPIAPALGIVAQPALPAGAPDRVVIGVAIPAQVA